MVEPIDCDVHIPGFSIRTGFYLANASYWAYEEQLGEWTDALGLGSSVHLFTQGEFHGFVGFTDRVAIVAFRGTRNVENCLTDLEMPLVHKAAYPGRVHHGFAEAVELVWNDVRTLLGRPSHARPVWVTGHSLGGAMATLASVRLSAEGFRIRGVYTYGSPRPGDWSFHNDYILPNYRFVNDDDIVPHLPLRWCYQHVGALKLLDPEGDLDESEAAWRDKKAQLVANAKRVQRACRNATETVAEVGDLDWLEDHHMGRYVDAIAKLLPRVPRRRRIDAAQPGIPQLVSRSPDRDTAATEGLPNGGAIARPCPDSGSETVSQPSILPTDDDSLPDLSPDDLLDALVNQR